ncbi:MAG: 30S ribosomal protein S15 [Candidatus Magasanikbacteria bacterium RIFOXYC2_FULL_40_16]|uniref:Small ribosomal subunit protein uS15 n=2 Tax=Candidatus Magasanikiibacteriota TaxID=1752731 RepID=A0A1F6NHD7_9BACT|nr:MAG: 30S ribosomal protein S15 [Candidatus Magasanikbacteria bacterium RIFOXYA2_FULL_40_20]OGH83173.1 MAG: 30S ribosomal protein S15 [Candidatus Magasanikbacteria bacterium RIFOXYB1_FULL_40_15]OGH86663.1 MAG: 30S ribosomal protein S15 [Candidatus Magasanikbacteria bacterium RIFOXYB2_FULL_40_13]OGH89447.1 MAG: 30S ribosomal protein S15 [Candidatus Magasanikbacteria bacterium RIFOXYC2_FULL_40_16]
MLDKQKKQKLIKKFQTHADDTGSSEVQIAILSAEIDELVEHLKQNPKDHSSRRGLLKKVGERRRLLRFLKKENLKSHEDLVKKLKLKQSKVLDNPQDEIDIEEDKDEQDDQIEK